eukprot:4198366-Lingulodinium_polyedra.AAC.1
MPAHPLYAQSRLHMRWLRPACVCGGCAPRAYAVVVLRVHLWWLCPVCVCGGCAPPPPGCHTNDNKQCPMA